MKMKHLFFAMALVMGAAWLPSSTQAQDVSPIMRAHNRGAKVQAGRRGFVRANHRSRALVPELNAAGAGASLILLLAAAELFRSRRREAEAL